jgi:hypothetical protein
MTGWSPTRVMRSKARRQSLGSHPMMPKRAPGVEEIQRAS